MKVLHVLVLLPLLAIALLMPTSIGPLSAAGIWVLCLILLARSQQRWLLSFASLYLLLLGIFHLGLVVPFALGVAGVEPPDWITSAHLPLSIGLVTTAIVAFTLGAHAGARREDATPAPPKAQPELFFVGLVFAAGGAAILVMGAIQLGVFSAGYDAFFERMVTDDVRLFWMGLMLFPIGLLVAAVGATRRQMILLGVLLVVVLGPMFLTGFRGPVIVHVVSLLAVWAHKDRRLARNLGAGVFAAALALAPAIRAARSLGTESDAPEAKTGGLLSVLIEAGGSLQPLVVTAEQIDGRGQELWWGRSYSMAAAHMLLNVSSRRSEEQVLTPSAWATQQVDSWAYEHGYGIGFSGVAEPYLNFGVVGIVLVFLLLGMVVQTWERWLSRDPFRAAIGAASFGFVLWTVRNEAMEVPRALAIAAVAVLMAWVIAEVRRWRASRSELAGLDGARRSGSVPP